MQQTGIRGKNKAADLKKLIQQACNTQKDRKPEPPLAPVECSKERI